MIKHTTSTFTLRDKLNHLLARTGLRRDRFRVQPGLYTLGNPDKQSSVFVTANYGLSFDKLRAALFGVDCYILVLDTKGINVWCAAGKGTFGTEELIHRIDSVKLKQHVDHDMLILPQLGAPGVAAHEVTERTGFRIEYGPVRAEDLPEYLRNYKATPEMRRVRFNLLDRLILIPVEVTHMLLPAIIITVFLYLVSGPLAALAILAIVVANLIIFPILLPWIPTPNFSTKGFLLGSIVAIPFFLLAFFDNPLAEWWKRVGYALPYLLILPSLVGFIGLTTTGVTTYASRSGVEREISAYFPVMFWMLCGGTLLGVIFRFIR
ncbi:carbon monoxide dehydrogenase [candidate division WOR_3 bacterium SM23_42]|uniref:Carbon monoxide dehydrogenase n=1 Tax=candidate division WOR_3 bacterium SM23_42 TaxID=1703779 RepID=A0A0S8FWG6_UNCW3|nr:MAG: carbon monoxide dehydrogenase [candidate division WOR_3 bacterium SM23_42]